MAKIIMQHISSAVDQQLRQEQAGFRKGGNALNKYLPYVTSSSNVQSGRDNFYINFVDFEKAFDSIHRQSLTDTATYGIP